MVACLAAAGGGSLVDIQNMMEKKDAERRERLLCWIFFFCVAVGVKIAIS